MSEAPKVILTLPTGEIRKYGLQMDSVRIGRAPDNTIVLEDPSLSAHHAVLHRRQEGFEIIDIGSTNGLEYEGQRVVNHLLTHGDEVKIGEIILRYEIPDAPASAFPSNLSESPSTEKADTDTKSADDTKEEGESSSESAEATPPSPPRPAPSENQAQESGGGGCLASIALFTLTLLAPVAGLHIAHYEKTNGHILLSDVIEHVQAAQADTTGPLPPPAKKEKPAEE